MPTAATAARLRAAGGEAKAGPRLLLDAPPRGTLAADQRGVELRAFGGEGRVGDGRLPGVGTRLSGEPTCLAVCTPPHRCVQAHARHEGASLLADGDRRLRCCCLVDVGTAAAARRSHRHPAALPDRPHCCP